MWSDCSGVDRGVEGGLQLGVVQDAAHPFLDGHLAGLPHELTHGYHACDTHAAHQHYEHATHVRQPQLIRCRARLRCIVLPTNTLCKYNYLK